MSCNYHILNIKRLENMLKVCFSIVFFIIYSFSFSQTNFVNNGAPIANTNVNFVINGNVIHQNNGSITNAGNFYIRGNWTNNNSTDNIFTSGNNGWVHFDSATQIINGSTLTHFNNLNLTGSGVKQLSGVDTEIEDTLSLNDREFDAGDNTVHVLATDTAIITRTDGFISSTNDGGLARNTASDKTYFFPVGSNLTPARFRPVDIIPFSSAPNTYKVRMANADPTTEMYDRTTKEFIVGEINPNFYHKINRTAGNEKADIVIYYNDTIDLIDEYDIIAYWEELTPEWKNPGPASKSGNYGLSSLAKKEFENFTSSSSLIPFALAVNVDLPTDVFVANVFSPNGDGNNDVLHVMGKGVTEIQFVIFNRWGEKVFETNDITEGWDGTYKGDPMNLAVFVYIARGKFKNGDEFDKKGNVTLVR